MELNLVKSFHDTLTEEGLKQCERDAFCSDGRSCTNSIVKLLLIKIRHLEYQLKEEKEKKKTVDRLF